MPRNFRIIQRNVRAFPAQRDARLVSVCFSPFDGPDRMLRTTFAFSGSRTPGSGGGKFKFELVALALANEGSGDMTTVESTRRLISTMVLLPHFEH